MTKFELNTTNAKILIHQHICLFAALKSSSERLPCHLSRETLQRSAEPYYTSTWVAIHRGCTFHKKQGYEAICSCHATQVKNPMDGSIS